MNLDAATLLPIAEIITALAAIALILRRGPSQTAIRRAFAVFALAFLLWNAAGLRASAWNAALLPAGLVALGVLFLSLSRAFLQQPPLPWWGWLLGALTVAAVYLLPYLPLAAPAAWGAVLLSMLWNALAVRRAAHQPLRRNRTELWLIVGLLVFFGGVAFLTASPLLGHGLLLSALLLATYAAVSYRVPDMRRVLRQMARSALVILLSALLYLASLFVIRILYEAWPQVNPWMLYGGLALGMAAIFKPAVDGLAQWSRRLIPENGYDPTRTVREYSLSISNILEINVLATVAIGLINEALEIESGMLFLVDRKPGADGKPVFELSGVRGMGQTTPLPLQLPVDNPLARRLEQNPVPLTQYEIDLHPEFRDITEPVRAWLARHNLDVYIPIYTKDEWIGMLALGPKRSGDPYQDDDLNLLRTLADQTAVALSNARLVEGLTRLNNDFRRAYNAMQKANLQLEKANQQLERLDRTKSDFISVTSHELRTPLTLISGYAQLLLEDAEKQNNEFHQQLLKGMLDGTTRMHAIISSMLDMASIDAQSIKLRVEPLMLAPLVRMVAKSYNSALEERHISLEITDMQGIPTVEADPEALEKILDHLLSNAIKYTPDGGRITVGARLLSPEKSPLREESVEIVVQDTGIGIDPKNLELIFTKFYQTGEISLHSSGKTKFKGGGPGLGLAIVHGLVQALNGKVWAYSEGHDEEQCPGSRFHVVLPRKQPRR